jgi:pyruvate kinase
VNATSRIIRPEFDPRAASEGNRQSLEALLAELEIIHADLLRLERQFEHRFADNSVHRKSARNLVHYLALRRCDIRHLQEQLAALGVSSLGRMESHVLGGLEAVLHMLHQLAQTKWRAPPGHEPGVGLAEGKSLLRANTDALLGPPPRKRNVRIMVTMPRGAADDIHLIRQLVANGMDCMRINCAHDDKNAWSRMVAHLQKAKQELRRECRVEMDLAGPKLRTGSIDASTQIAKWRPQRDLRGNVTRAAEVWLTPVENPEPARDVVDGCLQIPAVLLANVHAGDSIIFNDLRGKTRVLKVHDAVRMSRAASCFQTVYLSVGDPLPFTHTAKRNSATKATAEAKVAPPAQSFILLKPDDALVLTRAPVPGRPALYDQGRLVRPATIACSLPEVFADLRSKEPIWFDDGKIGGVIESVTPDEVMVRITIAKPGGDKLGADKGINLPQSKIRLPALTEKDIADLTFIVKKADIVGLSFVRRPEDVAALQAELARLNASEKGILVKIETQTGFEHLPAILLQALRSPHVGVMIARGDLAVECGWERLAEAQEEILWICEAAHVPVIWATQVLEGLAKKGAPSRAEITDAAMGERAECVMLNKGPHLAEAVRVLDGILCRMETHQSKKSARLRRLHLSEMGE